MPLSRAEIIRLIQEAEPRIGSQFIAAIMNVATNAPKSAMLRAIRARDTNGVWAELDMKDADFNGMQQAAQNAYGAAGTAEAARSRFKFNLFDQRALQDQQRRVGRFIAETIQQQRDMIRERVLQAIVDGANPRDVITDIVGTKRLGTHNRTGGILGLTNNQDQWARNAFAELDPNDPRDMRGYLERDARDRRFDSTVRKSIREGRPIPSDTRRKMIEAYRSRLLKLRGEAVGRTESLSSVNAGRNDAFEQAVNDPENPIQGDELRRTWIATRDDRVRDAHATLSGQVRRHNVPFDSPTGAALMYPGDSSLGAGPADLVNCRCTAVYQLD